MKLKPHISRSGLEEDLWLQIRAHRLSAVIERQFRFIPERKYRADFACSFKSLLFEVEGGSWLGGRHTRGKGFELDCEKYNLAGLLGWRVFRFTGAMVKDGRAIQTIKEALE